MYRARRHWYRSQGYGGGLYQAGGTVILTRDHLCATITSSGQRGAGAPAWKRQNGGTSGPGGIGHRGGPREATNRLLLNNETLTNNLAQDDPGGKAYREKFPRERRSGGSGVTATTASEAGVACSAVCTARSAVSIWLTIRATGALAMIERRRSAHFPVIGLARRRIYP
jgi:hypothetical protein